MAAIYYTNAAGDYIRDDDDKYMRGEPEDCCCGCDCEAEGAGPTADFSYTQTDDDPCTITLHDESVAGTCGEIVQWRWYKNGVLQSSSQNPSFTVTDGDDVTLEVTDSAGCTDSAVMEIECEDMVDAGCCSDSPLPNSVEVTSSGWSDNGANCPNGDCTFFNGSHSAAWTGAYYETASLGPECTGAGSNFRVEVQLCGATGTIAVLFRTDGFGAYFEYRLGLGSAPCRGTHVVPFNSSFGQVPAKCNRPASCTVTI